MPPTNRKTYGRRPTRTTNFSTTFVTSTPPHVSSKPDPYSPSLLPPSSPPTTLARKSMVSKAKSGIIASTRSSLLLSSSPTKLDPEWIDLPRPKHQSSLETAASQLMVASDTLSSLFSQLPEDNKDDIRVSSLETAVDELLVSGGDKDALVTPNNIASLETALEGLMIIEQDENAPPGLKKTLRISPKEERTKNNLEDQDNPRKRDRKLPGRPKRTFHDGKENEPPFDKSVDKHNEIAEKSLRNRKVKVQAPSSGNIPPRSNFSYARSLLEVCGDDDSSRNPEDQTAQTPTDFQAWADAVTDFYTVHKIAEASYGEVYKLRLRADVPPLRTAACSESVLKIIPLRPPTSSQPPVKCKLNVMSEVSDVQGEVELLKRLTPIPGFTCFRGANVMRGPLPKQWIAAWRLYRSERKASQKEAPVFPDPSRKGNYAGDSQLWCVIEMGDAGTDLEKLLENPHSELKGGAIGAWDVFWGVALAVAKGEEEAEFEHRDLHVGNICIKYGQRLDDSEMRNVGRSGIRTTLIDYTLSRAQMEDYDSTGTGRVAFFDLEKDPEIFEGVGEYQYDVYRLMREEVFSASKASRHWQAYHPRTNALWLHYLLKMLCSYLSSTAASSMATRRAEKECEKRLHKLMNALDPIRRKKGFVGYLGSAKDVVGYALEHKWLSENDIVECDMEEW